jgi:tetratricopeptide (TPR) repeat protein
VKSEFKFFLCLILCFVSTLVVAQNTAKIDSLENLLKNLPNDTLKTNIYNQLSVEYRKKDFKKAIEYAHKGLALAKKISFKKGEANINVCLANNYSYGGVLDSAEYYFLKAIALREANKDEKGQAMSLNSLGNLYVNQGRYQDAINKYILALNLFERIKDSSSAPYNNLGVVNLYIGNYEDALNFYFKGLKLFEKTGEQDLAYNVTLGAGNVYAAMKKYKDALIYYQKALAISTAISNKSGISKSLNNIGSIYESLHKNDTALSYYKQSLKIKEELGDNSTIAVSLMSIGNIYASGSAKNYEKALEYYRRGLSIYEEINNKGEKAKALINIGSLYSNKGDTEKAIQYLKLGLEAATEIESIDLMMKSNEEIAALYFKNNDYKNAYIHHKNYTTLKDSILNETTSKNIAEIQTKYETEKKEKEIESLTKDQLLKDAKIQSQNNLRNAFIIGIVLLVLLIILTYNRYLIKQKANKEIGEKNKEITESISYAKRIQSSFLTSEKYIAQRLSDYFIYYNPRNIVSGDFYWLMEKNNNLYICTADCTGHGIPGAFMSLISMGVLNEIIYSKTHITRTDEILNELRRIIILAVNPEGATEEARDGMDAVMCRFDFDKMELEYSSANNSFCIIRNGELLVFKPDKMPVGKHVGEEKPFTRNTITLQKGDCIYTFSDGYADQFGGPKGKKFQSKRLKELFLNHCHKPMAIQKEIYAQTLTEWKGANEQVDDILVMGIRI